MRRSRMLLSEVGRNLSEFRSAAQALPRSQIHLLQFDPTERM
jgi:hypothetical protein